MTESVQDIAGIDPEQLFADDAVDAERRTYTHEDAGHCEATAAGRAIVGVTDDDGRLLLLVNRDEEHAVLPNETVDADEDWAAAGRRRVEEMAGIDVALDGVERVRRVEHVVEDEGAPPDTTHHVVFGASPASDATLDGLCEDNDWEMGWHDGLPVEDEDDDAGALDDIRLFLE